MVLIISIKLLAIRVANSRTVCSIDASGAVGSLETSKVDFVSASSVVPNYNRKYMQTLKSSENLQTYRSQSVDNVEQGVNCRL